MHVQFMVFSVSSEYPTAYSDMFHHSLCAALFEPLGGVFIGSGDTSNQKPALFVVSCGEGHLDLRTADKVRQ